MRPTWTMGRFLTIVAAIAVLLSLVLILSNRKGDDPAEQSVTVEKPPTLSGHKPARLSSEAAVKRLMDWRDAPFSDAPAFRKIDALAGHLEDAAIVELLRELGFAKGKGYDGWIRAALFAEWGRRDPQAAIAWISAQGDLEGVEESGASQAWFALFRGWGETDPTAAAKALEAQTKGVEGYAIRFGWHWSSYARTEVFRSFARKDPESAWEFARLFRDSDEALYRDSLKGVLRGLKSSEDIEKYIALWSPELSEPQAAQNRADYRQAINSLSSGFIARPSDEAILLEAAISLAKSDFSTGWEWLKAAAAADQMLAERQMDFIGEWARRNPDRAMQQMDDPDFQRWRKAFGAGALDQEFGYASEVMAKVEDHDNRVEVLRDSLSVNGSGHVRDNFPVPGGPNRLPDFADRYATALDALEVGNFDPKRKTSLLKRIHEHFRHNVPAAAAALETESGASTSG